MSNFCVLNSIAISIYVFWLILQLLLIGTNFELVFAANGKLISPSLMARWSVFCEHLSISCLFRSGSPLKLSPSCRPQRRFLDDILKTLRRHHFPLRYTQQMDYPKKRRSHVANFSSSDKANKKFLPVVGMSIVDTLYILAGFFSYRKMITR